MKKQHNSWKTAAIAIALVLPMIVSAQTAADVEVSAGIGATIDAGAAVSPTNVRTTLKQRIEQGYQERVDNARNNEDYRNQIIQKRASATSTFRAELRASTTAARADIRDERRTEASSTRAEARVMIREATSSAERWGIRHDAALDIFKERQTAFVKQLQLSLDNLQQISVRINDRISKLEQAGIDMTAAKAAMVTASAKIDAAKISVDAVAAYTPAATSTTATTTVDLGKPRMIGEGATKAVRDARDALQQVVNAIVKALGLQMGEVRSEHATTTVNSATTVQ
jgi:hypothetical protein